VGFKKSVSAVRSLDLNYPPTAVGGISEFSNSLGLYETKGKLNRFFHFPSSHFLGSLVRSGSECLLIT